MKKQNVMRKQISVRTLWDENKTLYLRFIDSFQYLWTCFWARYSGISLFGRFAARLASLTAPPHIAGDMLPGKTRCGFFIAPSATIYHSKLWLSRGVYISDRVIIYQNKFQGIIGGDIVIDKNVRILRDSILETGQEGCITIGEGTWIHPRCQINAYKSSIEIGKRVDIAANCALYSYDHGVKAGKWTIEQPLTSKGPIIIEDGVWLGFGVIVLSGVHIGKGAVIGAGSIVTKNIPDNAVAVGSPAKVIKMRE